MINYRSYFLINSAQLLRYLVVGFSTGLLFFLSAVFLTTDIGISKTYSIFLSYALTTPLSFYFQKKYAFKSEGKWFLHLLAFVLVTVFICFYNLLVITYIFPTHGNNLIILSNWLFICLINYFFYRSIFK